ncbi:hypothetical protein VHEMI07678 [[Torrubiella] hemipterigena]|uniref:Uncharacterized protein n=1 Tax=[Torrubiella] hemipterigena TaxID=1531966 RepID=A0A0A1TNC5_9HYPO|nr:hypothetical protein VHEMI07678 [[Torrubiella] hemipterigena]
MAPNKRSGKGKAPASSKLSPPAPFKEVPDIYLDFVEDLEKEHVYITHIDSKPADFKRKIFMVPVAMNIAVVCAFVWRMWHILPYYGQLALTFLGHVNETSFPFADSTWSEFWWEVGTRGITMFIDFVLFVFVWPWPVEFVAAQAHGNPTVWRWNVGFRDKEIYVRRSRDWDKVMGDIFKDADSKKIFVAYVQQATAPMLQEQKTGYLLMSSQWDLDWDSMILAHVMVDKKELALDAFKNVVLKYHDEYGWMTYDLKQNVAASEEEKRRQVFAFRDALVAMGKEDLFYRWIEVVQYEASQPGGFGPEQQTKAAEKIRELFEKQNVNFDELWKETVGTDGISSL